MSDKALDTSKYLFTEKDKFFFDTNIWIYLYCPAYYASKRPVRLYSQALKSILTAKSLIFIDVLVMSEFINRYARLEYEKLADGVFSTFKGYRKDPSFKSTARAIANTSRRILKHCKQTQTPFELLDINAILTAYEADCPDFNDQIIAETCKANNLTLITHDSDFTDYGLTILTANKRILKVL